MGARGVDLEEGDDRGRLRAGNLDHAGEQRVAGVDEVVAEQHGERLVAHVHVRAQHGVAESEGRALAHVVHVGELGRELHLAQLVGVALLLKGGLELWHVVEVVLQGVLVAPGDHEHVGQARAHCLFDDVLDGRLIDDRQHFFGHCLCRWQKSGAESGSGDDCFRDCECHSPRVMAQHP